MHPAPASAAQPAPARPAPLARLAGASKLYRGGVLALDGIDLQVEAGEVVALLGPNGAGKSTAIALLCGLAAPTAGRAELFGADPRQRQPRQGLGAMLQQADLPDALSVREQVTQFSGYYPDPRPVEETLALCGLAAIADKRYGKLSGGQERRVQFALAVCGRPRLVVVDEPTTGLDSEARSAFWNVLRQLVAAGTGMLLTTHYLEEADALADRVVLLAAGRVLAEGTPRAIKQRTGGALVRCQSTLDEATLLRLPGVQHVRQAGRRVEIACAAAEPMLRALLDSDRALSDLEVQPTSLDEALRQLTREAA